MLNQLEFPPIADAENEYLTFDFSGILNGATISSVHLVNCSLIWGRDESPESRVIGNAVVVGNSVKQLFGTMIGGSRYLIQCYVETSDGQQLAVQSRVNCVAANIPQIISASWDFSSIAVTFDSTSYTMDAA